MPAGLVRALIALAIPLAFSLVEIRHVAYAIHITNLDYFPQVDWALRLRWDAPSEWMSPYYPAGFPWLVRLGLGAGIDAARLGHGLAIIGGVLGLLGTYLLALSLTQRVAFAVICQALTAVNATYLRFAGFEGNDLLAAGLQVLSLGLLVFALARGHSQGKPSLGWVAVAGLLVGLGYLVRYPSMLTFAAGALTLLGLGLYEKRRAVWKALTCYGGAFLLSSSPQWLASLIAKGSPFSNDQAESVWFQVFEKADYIVERAQVPPGITIFGVFALDPARFVTHWVENFSSFWFNWGPGLFAIPLGALALLGLAYVVVLAGAVSLWVRAMVLLYVLFHVGVLALLRMDPRFLVLLIPVLTVCGGYALLDGSRRLLGTRRGAMVGAIGAVAALAISAPAAADFAAAQPKPPEELARVSDLLRAAGGQRPEEVLSTELALHDLTGITRLRYPQAYWVAPGHETLESLRRDAAASGFRFLVYGRAAGPRSYPQLTDLVSPERRPSGLTPLYKTPDLVVYRLENSAGTVGVKDLGRFEAGISLTDTAGQAIPSASVADRWVVGVYLTWKTEAVVPRSNKIFVHIVDAGGQLVAQDDGFPAVWSYPTPNWRPGESVIDYHVVTLGDGAAGDGRVRLGGAPYTLLVGLYDEQTGERLRRLDASGVAVDDKVAVGNLVAENGGLVFRGP